MSNKFYLYVCWMLLFIMYIFKVYIGSRGAWYAEQIYMYENRIVQLKEENEYLAVQLYQEESLQYIYKRALQIGFIEPKASQIISIKGVN